MKHVQNNREVVEAKARAAEEKDHAALVLTQDGLHSDVYLLTEKESLKLVNDLLSVFGYEFTADK